MALRCMHEAKGHEENTWLTLTYDDEFLPYGGSLVKEHLQRFFKRLRRKIDPIKIRYFSCGEYGGKNTRRPHYHICLFGYRFRDELLRGVSDAGEDIFGSVTLDRIWGKGDCGIGTLNWETAAYTARYCLKKITGDSEKHVMAYTRILLDGTMVEVLPEFSLMTLGTRKRGTALGARHYERYKNEIYPDDICVSRGVRSKPPRYYDKLLEEENPELYEKVKAARQDHAKSSKEDETLERRTARETVKHAQIAQCKRSL